MSEQVKLEKSLSPLQVCALALGSIVGWGCFVLPGDMFLPQAGPVGTLLGFFVGACLISFVAVCLSYMVKYAPVAGGAFAYAYIGFGPRAAFVCGWALVIGYLAIVAIDIAALSVIFRFLFPGVFEFGELYSIAGWTVYSGEVILMTAGTLFFGYINYRGIGFAGALQLILAFMLTFGILALFGGVLTDDGFTKASGYLDSDASIAAMNKLIELHDQKIFTIRDVDGSVDAWDGINSEYAMFFEGPWYFGSYDDCEAKGIVAATIPTYEGRSASVVGGEDIAVFSTSKQKDAAYEFAKFMTSEEVQLAMLEAGQLPILKSLVENDAVKNNPVWSVYMKQMESAKARIPSPNNAAIQEIWSEMVTSIFVEGADAAQAMHDAAAKIDGQLS